MDKRVLTVASTLALVGATALPAFAGTKSIKVGDNYFVRSGAAPTVSVSKGTTVKWAFRGATAHNVTVQSGPARFSSRTQSSGTFARKVTKKGTYSIVCTLHGGMEMKLKVR